MVPTCPDYHFAILGLKVVAMVGMARTAVASFAAATGPLALVVDFLVDFLEGLFPIRDFLVIAIVVSPRIWKLTSLRRSNLQAACQIGLASTILCKLLQTIGLYKSPRSD